MEVINTRPTLLDDYPRWMGHPRQDTVVYTREQRDSFLKFWLRRADVYISVYKFLHIDIETSEPDRDSAWIDKVFFDFDGEDWLECLKKVHYWCEAREIFHRLHCSGRGGHAFIFTNPMIRYKKMAVGNFQRYLCKELKVTMDKKVIGDTSRIFRYPNTYNFNAERYCIPISNRIVNENLTTEIVFDLAKHQQLKVDPWIGSKLLSLNAWDKPRILYSEEQTIDFNLNEIDENIRTSYPEFPPCVQSWLSTPIIDDEGKFYITIFLKDQTAIEDTFDAQAIISILRQSLSKGEFEHYFGNSKGDLQRRHAGHLGVKFKRAMEKDYYLPDCLTLRKKGYCPADCGRRHPIYK